MAAAANIATANEGEIRLRQLLATQDKVLIRRKESAAVALEMVSAYKSRFDDFKEAEKDDFESHLSALYLVGSLKR